MSGAADAPVTEFTADTLVWRPYLTPIAYDQATPEQRAALSETPSNTKISDYVLVLAHDPESLAARTPLFNGIMYARRRAVARGARARRDAKPPSSTIACTAPRCMRRATSRWRRSPR